MLLVTFPLVFVLRRCPMARAAESTRRPVEILSGKEVHRLIDACSGRASAGIRMRAMIAVMYGSGLRIAELLALLPRDVDLEERRIMVHHGKGDKPRPLGMDAETVIHLERWMRRRASYKLLPSAPLFCTYSGTTAGQPIHQQQVREALFRAARRAGIEKRVHPHQLRHSFAYRVAAGGTPMNVLQKMLGHSSLAVTDRYVDHVGSPEVHRAMREMEW